MFNPKAIDIILNSLQKSEKEKKNLSYKLSFQIRAILKDFYSLFIFLSKKEMTLLWTLTVEWS